MIQQGLIDLDESKIYVNEQGTPALFDKDGNSIVWVNLLEKYGIEFK